MELVTPDIINNSRVFCWMVSYPILYRVKRKNIMNIGMKFGCFYLFTALLSLVSARSLAQAKSNDCSKIRKGHFYFFSKKVNGWSEIFRKDSLHTEIELNTKDTLIYRVNWLKPCVFTMQLIKSTQTFEPGEESFTKSFVHKNEILLVTKKYYTFKSVVSSAEYKKDFTFTDTVWFKRR
jgi:hypothetical protein